MRDVNRIAGNVPCGIYFDRPAYSKSMLEHGVKSDSFGKSTDKSTDLFNEIDLSELPIRGHYSDRHPC